MRRVGQRRKNRHITLFVAQDLNLVSAKLPPGLLAVAQFCEVDEDVAPQLRLVGHVVLNILDRTTIAFCKLFEEFFVHSVVCVGGIAYKHCGQHFFILVWLVMIDVPFRHPRRSQQFEAA